MMAIEISLLGQSWKLDYGSNLHRNMPKLSPRFGCKSPNGSRSWAPITPMKTQTEVYGRTYSFDAGSSNSGKQSVKLPALAPQHDDGCSRSRRKALRGVQRLLPNLAMNGTFQFQFSSAKKISLFLAVCAIAAFHNQAFAALVCLFFFSALTLSLIFGPEVLVRALTKVFT